MLDVVVCCCAKFETGQTFQPTTPNISFVPWSPKRSATMLDPFAELFQHCWCHARSLRMVYKTYDDWRLMGCILPTMHCRSQNCWELLHPFAHQCQHARNNSQHCWPNNVGSCCFRLNAALRNKMHLHSTLKGCFFVLKEFEVDSNFFCYAATVLSPHGNVLIFTHMKWRQKRRGTNSTHKLKNIKKHLGKQVSKYTGKGSKGLFTWRWGTPGRWGNLLRWGKKITLLYMQSYNPAIPGCTFSRLLNGC